MAAAVHGGDQTDDMANNLSEPHDPDVLPKDIDGAAAPVVQSPFPWEYFDVGMELRELSMAPSRLETRTPSFFDKEVSTAEGTAARSNRNSTVARLLDEKKRTSAKIIYFLTIALQGNRWPRKVMIL